ncbi:prephenate dehydrogenase [Paenibacillus thermoaerophilus]|uniref:Prephenate dehydrogenase n=1 Tax=Paenibacillus thermoaerophilus TaxID=1215385 RepID=A0ABW2V6S5_9BACL|nr:prephenate dehydrogenase [Paenibacillus thermoaerophilus]TMV18695.1 prephenate dehydrogenase [Paenibacillus thermoaerophilus]
MTKVAIMGVGLIGGSLALCLKGKPGITVYGYSRNPSQAEKYLKLGVVDEAGTDMGEAVRDADFIFLCGPVSTLEPQLEQLASMPLKPGCIVSDVGSTKASLVACARRLALNGVWFIGGHPMAGSERSGVEAASSHLFENAFYVLTPLPETPEDVYDRLAQLLKHTKAQLIRLDAQAHDEIVGAISHLPHVIAVALVNQIARYNDGNELYRLLAAGGFKDITRIASSDSVIWRDILLNNREVVLKLLDDWNREMEQFRLLLESGDGDGIERRFRDAKAFREQMPERRKGVLTSLYDVYVDVPDHPGVIGEIASAFGERGINLSNIHIMESREEVPGVLRLSFRQETDWQRAIETLKGMGYSVHM